MVDAGTNTSDFNPQAAVFIPPRPPGSLDALSNFITAKTDGAEAVAYPEDGWVSTPQTATTLWAGTSLRLRACVLSRVCIDRNTRIHRHTYAQLPEWLTCFIKAPS